MRIDIISGKFDLQSFGISPVCKSAYLKSEIAGVLEQVTVIAQKQSLEPKTIRTLKKKTISATKTIFKNVLRN